jgi:outer membrane protein TolC
MRALIAGPLVAAVCRPQLTALEDEALAHAPDARSALAVLDEARATRSKALLAYDVQGNASGSITRGQTSISGNSAFQMAPTGATTTGQLFALMGA